MLSLKTTAIFLLLLVANTVFGDAVPARFKYPTTAKTLFTPHWRRDFVRNVREVPFVRGAGTQCADLFERIELPPELPENFLLNQSDGATHIYGWLRGEGTETFEQALAQQHKIAAVGPNGDRAYWNNGGAVPYSSTTVSPGVFRVELPKDTILGDEFEFSPAESTQLTRLGYKPITQLYPEIPGLPRPLTVPTNRYRGLNRFTRTLPQGEAEKIYRAAVVAQAAKIREWMKVPKAEAKRRANELAADLAQFYYLGIHWMPFDSINNSLFMVQVNAVLRHQGFKTLEHGRIDYIALGTPPAIFGKYFTEEFGKQNP